MPKVAEMKLYTVLILESSRVFRKLLLDHLSERSDREAEWKVEFGSDLGDAVGLLSETVFDAIILNPNLKDSTPSQSLERIRGLAPDTAIVIATSNDDEWVGGRSVLKGVQDVLFKPEITPLLLRKTLLFAISRQHLQLVAQEREKLLLSRLAERGKKTASALPVPVEECSKVLNFLEREVAEGELNTSVLARLLSQSVLKTRVKVESFKGISWLSFKIPAKRRETAERVVAVADESESSKRCLVVEDSLVNQKIVVRTLEKLGYKVGVSGNGKEALEVLREEYFPLVLMDVQMPVMDGIEATRHIRGEFPEIRQPSIIALTASDLDRYSAVYYEAGMDGCICKPVTTEKLELELQKVFTGK